MSDKDIAPHWQEVMDNCKGRKDFDTECFQSWYGALGEENDLEWLIAVKMWFYNQPIIAFFGSYFSEFAFILAIYFMLSPVHVPDTDMADVDEDDSFLLVRALWLIAIGFTSNLIKPEMFFIT